VRSLVFGYVAILWGGLVVGYGLTRGLDGSAYAAGSIAGVALGFALLVSGGWMVVRRARKSA
jgi:hypothetical protein